MSHFFSFKHLKFITFGVVLFLVTVHIVALKNYTVNIPYQDEWELFKPHSFVLDPNFTHLFQQHNEHKLVIPKLFFKLYYDILNFDILTCLILNLLFFGLCVFFMLKISDLRKHPALLISSLLLLFSPINFENHLWVFQIQWHLFLLFLIITCHALSKDQIAFGNGLKLLVLPFFLIYTLGSGLAGTAGLILFFFILQIWDYCFYKNKLSVQKIIFILSSSIAILSFLLNYTKPSYHPELYLPYQIEFWKHFSSIITLGFGVRIKDFSWLFLFPFFTHAAYTVYAIKSWHKRTDSERFLYLFATSMLAILASISISRAGFGPEQAFSSRYFEFSSFYMVSIVCLISKIQNSKIKKFCNGLAFFIFISSILSYRFSNFYQPMFDFRNNGLECVKNSYKNKDYKTVCSGVYTNESVTEIIENLKKIKPELSFLKQFE